MWTKLLLYKIKVNLNRIFFFIFIFTESFKIFWANEMICYHLFGFKFELSVAFEHIMDTDDRFLKSINGAQNKIKMRNFV